MSQQCGVAARTKLMESPAAISAAQHPDKKRSSCSALPQHCKRGGDHSVLLPGQKRHIRMAWELRRNTWINWQHLAWTSAGLSRWQRMRCVLKEVTPALDSHSHSCHTIIYKACYVTSFLSLSVSR